MSEDFLGFLAVLGLTFAIGAVVSFSRLPRTVKLLVYAALALRVVGTLGRYYMVTELYGRGDSFAYFRWGIHYAALLWEGDFEGFFDPEKWSGSKWWGTQFVRYLTGVVVALIGPSFLGGYLVYSLLALLGLGGFAMAFSRAYPHVPLRAYARWIWLFPSLWFWPSAIGKEAVLLMGLGLVVAGFVGYRDRINWPLLAVGIFFVFAIRVQVAAVVILSLILAHWLSLGGRWTVSKTAQGLVILAAGLFVIRLSAQHMGIDSFDMEGVQGYMEANTGRGGGKGSAIDGAAVGLAGVPMALVNILFRPFPWEASSPLVLITSLEIMALWAIAWYRRRTLVQALRNWRSDRFLRMAIPFILVYSVTLGMLVANMGIIARQRIFLFPFLFLLIEAVPRAAAKMRPAPVPLAAPAPVPAGVAPPRRAVRAVRAAR